MACFGRLFLRDIRSYDLSTVPSNIDEHVYKHRYRDCNEAAISWDQNKSDNFDVQTKQERSESGFDSINDGLSINNTNDFNHIQLNIPLPPTRKPPEAPIASADFSPQQSPVPIRKFHRQTIPDINFIESTPSPILKGNHNETQFLIESNESNDIRNRESEIKIDELHVEPSSLNMRKEGIIAERINVGEMEEFQIKIYPKDRK
ncbi:CLUMA_CG006546, isoform A [Clunio marinus]|uniref:CLUMA_CG006546, isoform A n=1 Tax=Clunio marinus TaxID=568069 RepID=A0A1J1I0E1_9DIPT|nr:CLUMA_CG006546, isoform A [Clunio marinus]